RRKAAIRAFDAVGLPPAPPRRRNPWRAVAAAAGLRGLWQNKPDFRRARDPWRAVAAAAQLRGVWQIKPDLPTARRKSGLSQRQTGVWQNKPDLVETPRKPLPPIRSSRDRVRGET